MKKLFMCVGFTLLMTSCFNTKVCVGNMKADDPAIKVNSVTNHQFLYGLIPGGNTKVDAKKYIGEKENYAIKNNWTFLNGFLGCITCGIYTPTTTTFYVPLDDLKK